MLGFLSQRILTLLQLTRMALVFTAIADGACEVLLRAAMLPAWVGGTPLWQRLALMGLTSIGLYGFGMSLNDIIDRRRDTGTAAHRPLPSGRLRPMTAYLVCTLLALLAIGAGVAYAEPSALLAGETVPGASMITLAATLLLIVFYDVGGKFFLLSGLLSLGLIRMGNAAIAAPRLPVVWHPLLLLNHVSLLSLVAYDWEQKRPLLRPGQRWRLLAALAGVDVAVVGLVLWRGHGASAAQILQLRPALLLPGAAVVIFWIGVWLAHRSLLAPADRTARREVGQKLMLYGLLWLIVYDAAFAAAFASWRAGLGLLLLLPLAWWSVQMMRWWSKLLSLGQRPGFQRARE